MNVLYTVHITNERADLFNMINWSRWGENHDKNVKFDEVTDKRLAVFVTVNTA